MFEIVPPLRLLRVTSSKAHTHTHTHNQHPYSPPRVLPTSTGGPQTHPDAPSHSVNFIYKKAKNKIKFKKQEKLSKINRLRVFWDVCVCGGGGGGVSCLETHRTPVATSPASVQSPPPPHTHTHLLPDCTTIRPVITPPPPQ